MIINFNNSPVQEDGSRPYIQVGFRALENGYTTITGINADGEEVAVGLTPAEVRQLNEQQI
ncbi:hypothetical protein LCGC14_1310570 [marine sediment metagenome]|uniref:Uncharacterized protein n=1 Tax=marine sediment metagenome TaxID=412755 RepID=A0A0F9KN15_9ZZZZ